MERGLKTEEGRLCVMHGSKGLRKAIYGVLGNQVLIRAVSIQIGPEEAPPPVTKIVLLSLSPFFIDIHGQARGTLPYGPIKKHVGWQEATVYDYFLSNARSTSTISRTRSSNERVYSQPSSRLALPQSPCRNSTSAGRTNLGSTTT